MENQDVDDRNDTLAAPEENDNQRQVDQPRILLPTFIHIQCNIQTSHEGVVVCPKQVHVKDRNDPSNYLLTIGNVTLLTRISNLENQYGL